MATAKKAKAKKAAKKAVKQQPKAAKKAPPKAAAKKAAPKAPKAAKAVKAVKKKAAAPAPKPPKEQPKAAKKAVKAKPKAAPKAAKIAKKAAARQPEIPDFQAPKREPAPFPAPVRPRMPPPRSKKAARGSAAAPPPAPAPPPVFTPSGPVGPRPLDGLLVLDLTTHLPGPAASMMLANFGAEVIKIEETGKGDPARLMSPRIHEFGATFALLNRGKKSAALDLTNENARAAFLDLIKKADVLFESSRPGYLQKLGLGYKDLQKVNPRLIQVALTGYGQGGPYANHAGADINYLSMAGALELIGGETGQPTVPGMQIAELAAGALPAVIGALLAITARHSNGKGQLVDVAMLDGVVGLLAAPLADYAATRRKPRYGQDRLFGKYACYNIYPARNSRWLAVGALDPRYWEELCKALERPDLIEDQFAEGDRQQVIIAELTRAFQKKEVREWMEHFQGKDVCVTEVRDISDAAHDEHLLTREVIVPFKHPEGGSYPLLGVYPKLTGTPGALGGYPPRFGEHTAETLKRAGLNKKQIEELIESGAAKQWTKEEEKTAEPVTAR